MIWRTEGEQIIISSHSILILCWPGTIHVCMLSLIRYVNWPRNKSRGGWLSLWQMSWFYRHFGSWNWCDDILPPKFPQIQSQSICFSKISWGHAPRAHSISMLHMLNNTSNYSLYKIPHFNHVPLTYILLDPIACQCVLTSRRIIPLWAPQYPITFCFAPPWPKSWNKPWRVLLEAHLKVLLEAWHSCYCWSSHFKWKKLIEHDSLLPWVSTWSYMW